MTEAQIGLLYNIASELFQIEHNQSLKLLRSYYLMRCKSITRGYGLPVKHFSSKTRCHKCCLEWNRDTEVKVQRNRLTKRQRQRIRSHRVNKELQNCNVIVQICTFCNNSTTTTVPKPKPEKCKTNAIKVEYNKIENKKKKVHVKIDHKAENVVNMQKKATINVYSNSFDVFSLKNKNNILASTVKEQPKIIKNNKKRKDKFVGLCQKAVLASAKMKEDKLKNNKLNLFLKPSVSS